MHFESNTLGPTDHTCYTKNVKKGFPISKRRVAVSRLALRKIFFFLCIGYLLSPTGLSYGREKIKIGYFSLEPHLIYENGNNTGALIDL
jgi:hypothetical protein